MSVSPNHSEIDHIVQFYQSEDFLYGAVADFLAPGVHAGEPTIVIATRPHYEGFSAELKRHGVNVGAPNSLSFLDAEEALATFMRNGMPDPELFAQNVGSVISRSAAPQKQVRAYGEMVDLLWRSGNPDAAIRLEELWNDLARIHDFSLLCAYGMGNFYKETDASQFDSVCRSHTTVIPTEAYLRIDESARGREITALQQRAEALKAEVEHRKLLEKALRDALSARRQAEETNAFLLQISTLLNRSLDSEELFRELAWLVVPRLADWCAVDIVADDGTYRRLAHAHADPAGVEAAGDLAQPAISPNDPVLRVLRSGEPELISCDEAFRSRMIVPIKLQNRVLGALTFATTESERIFAATDLPLAMELAQRAASAIENARLYRLATQANRSKDEFLATLSHELRTPLTAILGWARLLSLGGLDEETMRTAIETIECSAHTQASLVEDLLDVSRVVTGNLTLNRQTVDLSRVVRDAVRTVEMAAEAKGIRIEISGERDSILVMGDPTRLQQICWNLLANAIKFSGRDTKISLTLQRSGDQARILVRDTGRGISPTFLPHVFEPFRQAEGTVSEVHGGLGLGLAIVKYLAELHGGTVTVASAGLGRGATFTVTLPMASARPVASQTIPDLSGISVLLVEDDSATRDLMAALMRKCGAKVRSASSVQNACEEVSRETPDVLVTDIAMPDQDGFALLKYLRSRELTAGIPVIALTGMGHSDAEKKLRDAGFNALVRKPVDPFEFAGILRTFLKPA